MPSKWSTQTPPPHPPTPNQLLPSQLRGEARPGADTLQRQKEKEAAEGGPESPDVTLSVGTTLCILQFQLVLEWIRIEWNRGQNMLSGYFFLLSNTSNNDQ